jgi:hypothetical protein
LADLERELRTLASSLDLPAERDLAAAVRERLTAQRRRIPRWNVPVVAVVTVLLLLSIGVTMAVPEARSAVLRWLGLQSVVVIRVDELPPAATGPGVFGERVSLAEAERVVGFRLLLPDIGQPDAVRVSRFSPGFAVLLYGRPRARLRLTELGPGTGTIEKFAAISDQVARVRVNRGPGIWVEGRHVVTELFGLPRFSGSVLLWEQGGLTLRLEGRMTRAQALEIAGTFG